MTEGHGDQVITGRAPEHGTAYVYGSHRDLHFTDATNQAIQVCSSTCAILQSNPQASITLTFGCVTNQIPE
jgi:hypothetical protein